MTSRKLNPDRIRRHMARSTPDVIRRTFDYMLDDYETKYKVWIIDFGRRMKIKHGHSVNIDVYVEDGFGFTATKTVIAEVSKRSGRLIWEEERDKVRLNLKSLPKSFIEWGK